MEIFGDRLQLEAYSMGFLPTAYTCLRKPCRQPAQPAPVKGVRLPPVQRVSDLLPLAGEVVARTPGILVELAPDSAVVKRDPLVPHWGSPGYVLCPPRNGFKF